MLNVVVDGHVCEMQVHLAKVLEIKSRAHVIYGVLRSVGWEGERLTGEAPGPLSEATKVGGEEAAGKERSLNRATLAAADADPAALHSEDPSFRLWMEKRGHFINTAYKRRFFTLTKIGGRWTMSYYKDEKLTVKRGSFKFSRGATVGRGSPTEFRLNLEDPRITYVLLFLTALTYV